MTPGQFVKAECPDYLPDGTCLKIEPSSPWDFRLPLPDWLTPERRAGYVADAREKGVALITLDKPRHPNRYRVDLCYCLGCDQRMGGGGDLCPECSGRPFVPDDVDRRCKVLKGERCGQFEQTALPLADQASPRDDPQLQLSRERARSAYLDTHVLPGNTRRPRHCPDCGGELPKGKQFCDQCRHSRRRATKRAARDRSCPNGDHKPLSAKAPNRPFSEVGVRTPKPSKRPNFCPSRAPEAALS